MRTSVLLILTRAQREKIRPYEPVLVKAAWNIFGDSYRYRQQYNDYKRRRTEAESQIDGQFEFEI